MSEPVREMSQQELVWAIEGYAKSARLAMDEGRDPSQTLRRVLSQIERFLALSEGRADAAPG